MEPGWMEASRAGWRAVDGGGRLDEGRGLREGGLDGG